MRSTGFGTSVSVIKWRRTSHDSPMVESLCSSTQDCTDELILSISLLPSIFDSMDDLSSKRSASYLCVWIWWKRA